jgi:hypothetical protein
MEKGIQLYGRRTWEAFATLWPSRDSDYARLMNTVPKRAGERLFAAGVPADFRFTLAEPVGAAVLTVLRRER